MKMNTSKQHLRAVVSLFIGSSISCIGFTNAQASTHMPVGKPQATTTKHAKISVAKAQQTVLRRFGGQLVGKTTLENEEGKWQYGVMVQSGSKLREVMVGAYSGRIENVELTTAKKENLEMREEKASEQAHKQKMSSVKHNVTATTSTKKP